MASSTEDVPTTDDILSSVVDDRGEEAAEPEVEQQPPALGAAMAAPPETTSTAAETTTEEKLHVIGPVMAESVRVVTTAYARRSDSHIKKHAPFSFGLPRLLFLFYSCACAQDRVDERRVAGQAEQRGRRRGGGAERPRRRA